MVDGEFDGIGGLNTDGWQVRPVSGAAARKVYRCPGCDQQIRVGQPHLVTWPDGDPDDRRHWHRACWDARDRRSPRPRRPR